MTQDAPVAQMPENYLWAVPMMQFGTGSSLLSDALIECGSWRMRWHPVKWSRIGNWVYVTEAVDQDGKPVTVNRVPVVGKPESESTQDITVMSELRALRREMAELNRTITEIHTWAERELRDGRERLPG